MFITDAQKLLSLGRGPLFVDARCRAAQDDEIVFQAVEVAPSVQTVCHGFPPLFLIIELERRFSQTQVVFTIDGIPESQSFQDGFDRDFSLARNLCDHFY